MAATAGEGLRLRPLTIPRLPGSSAARDGGGLGEQPVSPTGKVFLHPTFYNVITCALEFRERMELERLQEHFRGTLGKHPRFRSRVVFRDRFGAPWARWVPVELDMAQHVHEVAPLPEDLAHPETAVERHMAEALSRPNLDPALPLWRAHLLHVNRANSVSTCIFIIHHALGDGTSLMSLLLAACRQTANPELLPNLPGQRKGGPAQQPHPKPAAVAASEGQKAERSQERAKEMGKSMSRIPGYRTLAVVKNSVVQINNFSNTVLGCADSATVLKAASEKHKEERVLAVSSGIPLAAVADVRKATGSTVNDVLVAVMALALEKYLAQRMLAEGKAASSTARGRIREPRVTAVGTVNLRKTPGLQSLSLMMEGNGGSARSPAPWGNRIGCILLRMPIAPEAAARRIAAGEPAVPEGHALGMLQATKRMCDTKKLSLEAPYAYVSGRMTMALSGTGGAAAMLARLLSNTTLSISNMLGPMEEVTMAGVPISSISPSSPPPQHALCCHFQSYNGCIKVVLGASRETYPDLQTLCSLFVQAFADLQRAIQLD